MRRLASWRALLAMLIVIGSGLGAIGGAYLIEWTGTPLQHERARVLDLERDLAMRSARILALEERVEERERAMAQLEGEIGTLRNQLSERDLTIAQLQAAFSDDGSMADRYFDLSSRYARLESDHRLLQEAHNQLQAEVASHVRIVTPEVRGDALILDRSTGSLQTTRAVCTGSMEPSITCNDLLLLYRPNISDIKVGDVIYFRQQRPDCSGPTENGHILHRITRVEPGPHGIQFRTRGDNSSRGDACPVPPNDVLYKLLANISNARMPE